MYPTLLFECNDTGNHLIQVVAGIAFLCWMVQFFDAPW